MLSKGEQRSFSNGRLRDQWEKRAQTIADQCKQEGQWKEKSSLKLLFSKWNYHWALAASGDQKKGKLFDFHRVTSDEAEKNKPKIKFKIVPPPPPKPKSKSPSPPSRKTSPQLVMVKRKVEVDIFRLHWRESWMSMKPPKYLFFKANETKTKFQGFTMIDVVKEKKYKCVKYTLGHECTPIVGWRQSWKQVKGTMMSECSGEKQFQWDILFDRDVIPIPEIGVYQLPVWAGTWKIMNFKFRQQRQRWDCGWPSFEQSNNNKFDEVQQLLEQEEPRGWKDSWRLSNATVNVEDSTLFVITAELMKINDGLLTGWDKSWLISAPILEEGEEDMNIWSSCWLYRLQLRWCRSSLQSHQRHSNMMTRKRNLLNTFLTFNLNDWNIDTTEWWDSWRTLKRWNPPGEGGLDEVKDSDSEDSELFNDIEEDEEEDNDEENDGSEGKELRDEGDWCEDNKENDEGVNEEEENDGSEEEEKVDVDWSEDKRRMKNEGVDEEEEAESKEIECNEEDINIMAGIYIRETDEDQTVSNTEKEDTENEEASKEDEERQEFNVEHEKLEEDIQTREMELQNNNTDVHNNSDEENENGDNRMTDDEKKDKVNEKCDGKNVDLKDSKRADKLDKDKDIVQSEEKEDKLNEYDVDNENEQEKVENRTKDKYMDEDVKITEEYGNTVKEEQVYKSITVQLREILRLISTEEEKERDEEGDQELFKIQDQVKLSARETQTNTIKRRDDSNDEEEDEEVETEEPEDEKEEAEENEVDEEQYCKKTGEEEEAKETEEEEDENKLEEEENKKESEGNEEEDKEMEEEENEEEDKIEKQDLKKEIKEEEEVETDDFKNKGDSQEDKENDQDGNQEKTDAEDYSNEGDDGSCEWDNNATDNKTHSHFAWGKKRKEQSQRADTEQSQTAEEEEDEVDVEKYVFFDEDNNGNKKVYKREVYNHNDDEEMSEEDSVDTEGRSLSIDQQAEKITENTDEGAPKKNDDGNIEEEKKNQMSRNPIKGKPKIPLHLQFHNLNTSFSLWKKSCMVAVAHRTSVEDNGDDNIEGEQEELKAWQESWRVCRWKKPHEHEVACFSTEHRWMKHIGVMYKDNILQKKEWTLSWKMTTKGEDTK